MSADVSAASPAAATPAAALAAAAPPLNRNAFLELLRAAAVVFTSGSTGLPIGVEDRVRAAHRLGQRPPRRGRRRRRGRRHHRGRVRLPGPRSVTLAA